MIAVDGDVAVVIDSGPPGAAEALLAALDAHGIAEFERPTICLRNGEPVLRADWPVLQICASDVVIFVSLPQGGGGGGGGGKNPLRTVLMIAVMVAAPAIGGAIAGAIGGAIGGATAGEGPR